MRAGWRQETTWPRLTEIRSGAVRRLRQRTSSRDTTAFPGTPAGRIDVMLISGGALLDRILAIASAYHAGEALQSSPLRAWIWTILAPASATAWAAAATSTGVHGTP